VTTCCFFPACLSCCGKSLMLQLLQVLTFPT
jgi:hypothetical protein